MIILRISKYKNIFANEYAPNWSEEGLATTEAKNTVLWTYDTSDLKGKKLLEPLQKRNVKNKSKREVKK